MNNKHKYQQTKCSLFAELMATIVL